MIHSEEDYTKGVRELGDLIERENTLDAFGLQRLSDLADALIAWEASHEYLDAANLSPKLAIRQGEESVPVGEAFVRA